jgi:ubiquinone/menaquinone biosynthesis C-methylase UbiE
MIASIRVDYDAIAHLYDRQPYRTKSPDPELSAFVSVVTGTGALSVLDIGCGTGNQLVANRAILPNARMVGLDRSLEMLRQAQSKGSDIVWVQADAAMLPFGGGSFDFITCQHAFHHVRDREAMLGEVLRVLRPGGRFVLHSLDPRESPDWLYYQYFPEAHAVDLKDFWSSEQIRAVMETAGFVAVTATQQHLHFEQNLRNWLAVVERRDTCSQLMAISDTKYAAGLHRLKQELADGSAPSMRLDHLCLVTIRGEKRIRLQERQPNRKDHG